MEPFRTCIGLLWYLWKVHWVAMVIVEPSGSCIMIKCIGLLWNLLEVVFGCSADHSAIPQWGTDTRLGKRGGQLPNLVHGNY